METHRLLPTLSVKRSFLPFALASALALSTAACGGSDEGGGSGGMSGTGGAKVGTGGSTATGGAPSGSGGSGSGGVTGTGGTASGGSGPGSGGAASGGTGAGGSASGGAAATGGSSGTDAGSSGGATGDGGLTSDASRDGGTTEGGTAGSTGAAYNPCPASGTQCKIMPFGDSITDGYNVKGGYRIPFFSRARKDAKQFTFVGSASNGPATVDGATFPQRHEGHSGYTINNESSVSRSGIAPLVATVIPQYKPDIVLLMIGTNDIANNVNLSNAPTRLGALIDSIIAQDAHILIVVAQLVPTANDGLNGRVQTYNAAMPALVKARADAGKHVLLVDMYGAFTKNSSYKTALLADDLHPNTAGYQVMSDTWAPAIYDLLR